jgi:hypothetical protein
VAIGILSSLEEDKKEIEGGWFAAHLASKHKEEECNEAREPELKPKGESMSNKWAKQLKAYEDAVKYEYDAFAPENCIYTPSPMVNWIFANKSHGLPKGTGLLLFSEPKAGKSLLVQAMVQELHRRDPEALAIIFNSEMRGSFQQGLFSGIDKDRLIIYDTNRPEDIFDRMEKDIYPMIQDGMPLGLAAFDSITNIGGTKSMSADRSVNDHLIGDKALTITKGWEKVVPIFKRHKIPYIGVEQMRKNVDASNPHAPKEKMAGVFSTKHAFEYWVSIKRANAADDKVDIEGNKFENDEVSDARGNKDRTGHKIYFRMEQSSLGVDGRAGVLTIDYKEGIINSHEEIFLLGKNTGIIKNLNAGSYELYGEKIRGKAEVAIRIRDDQELAKRILADLKALDSK